MQIAPEVGPHTAPEYELVEISITSYSLKHEKVKTSKRKIRKQNLKTLRIQLVQCQANRLGITQATDFIKSVGSHIRRKFGLTLIDEKTGYSFCNEINVKLVEYPTGTVIVKTVQDVYYRNFNSMISGRSHLSSEIAWVSILTFWVNLQLRLVT